jgi:hypothetical protein
MAKQRSTFSKFQRERDKKAKAAAKRERRENKPDVVEDEATESRPQVDQTAVLEALAALHRDFDDGRVDSEDFEKRREELITQIDVD